MRSFSKEFLDSIMFHPCTTWFISQCGEARGMQEMWNTVRPDILKKLKESAIIQSTESSNRIEGVIVSKERLRPLVLGETKPRDRSEEEVAGYRKALTFIHQRFKDIQVTPETIKHLHTLAQGGMISDAGEWTHGNRFVRFRPVSAKDTDKAMEQLCLGYADVTNNSQLPELASIAFFILDFLCIHPFRDGNGRVSRLLTTLLLYQHHFEVGKYISIEKIIENTKEDYDRVLAESSENWHTGGHQILPWLNYFLSTIKMAYQDLKEKVELSNGGDNQSSLIKHTILSFETSFSISDIQNLHPNISRALIKKVSSKLREKKQIESTGKGRGAKWVVLKHPQKSKGI